MFIRTLRLRFYQKIKNLIKTYSAWISYQKLKIRSLKTFCYCFVVLQLIRRTQINLSQNLDVLIKETCTINISNFSFKAKVIGLSFLKIIQKCCSFSNTSGNEYDRQWEALAGWFLGPRAENRYVFNELMMKALNWHEDRREEFFPADPCYFTEQIKNSEAATAEYKDLEKRMKEMHEELNRSIPFFSTRYQVFFFIKKSECSQFVTWYNHKSLFNHLLL